MIGFFFFFVCFKEKTQYSLLAAVLTMELPPSHFKGLKK